MDGTGTTAGKHREAESTEADIKDKGTHSTSGTQKPTYCQHRQWLEGHRHRAQ
jgi:hypothetical protein